jgi:hypothetical protein
MLNISIHHGKARCLVALARFGLTSTISRVRHVAITNRRRPPPRGWSLIRTRFRKGKQTGSKVQME